MKRKYFNVFWVLLATVIILNEFVIGFTEIATTGQIKLGTFLLIFLWASVAIQNVYSYYIKSKLKYITPQR